MKSMFLGSGRRRRERLAISLFAVSIVLVVGEAAAGGSAQTLELQ